MPVVALSKAKVCAPLACCDCGFEPDRGAWMFFSCECCVLCSYKPLLRVYPSSRGVLPSVCVCVCVSLGVIRCNSNLLHLQWVGRQTDRGQIMKKRDHGSKFIKCYNITEYLRYLNNVRKTENCTIKIQTQKNEEISGFSVPRPKVVKNMNEKISVWIRKTN